jgi:hypothetical protein
MAILLDNHKGHLLATLIGCEAVTAFLALTPAPDGIDALRRPGIDNLEVLATALRTTHTSPSR